jgi:hypothetical protein
MNNLQTRLANKDVLLWGVHFSGNLQTPTSAGVAGNLGGGGHPLFFVNEDDMDVSSSNGNAKLAEIEQTVELLNSFAPIAKMGATAILDGTTLNVNAKVNFTEDIANGQYFTGIYLIKDNLIAPQASVGNNASHTNILDKSLLPIWYGSQIAAAPIAANSTFDVSATLENFVPHNNKLEDSKIAVVTFNKLNNKYIFLNASVVNIDLQSSVNPDLTSKKLGCKCQVTKGNINIELFNNLSSDTNIILYDAQGKTISNRFSQFNAKDFVVETGSIPSGVYYIHVRSGNQSLTQPVYIH